MHLNRAAYNWLKKQVDKLANIVVADDEIQWLRKTCPYFSGEYLDFLRTFRLIPSEHVDLQFHAHNPASSDFDSDEGDVSLFVKGRWLDTILYEIPLLALVSESYFKFCDTDWDHEAQAERAHEKGTRLLEAGCSFSEFGSRRRRDYKTHDLVMQGLARAQKEAEGKGYSGKWSGTSNVHFAKKYGVPPVGTVAHEWFMGIAAITDDYPKANETALQYWIGTFGRGVCFHMSCMLSCLTDTTIDAQHRTDRYIRNTKLPRSL